MRSRYSAFVLQRSSYLLKTWFPSLLGGGLASDTAGQFVAKFNPSTGQQIWLTYINAANPLPAGQWNAYGSIGVIADGTIIAVAGTTIVKLDPSTGSILKSVQLGVSSTLSSPINANFDGFLIAPMHLV